MDNHITLPEPGPVDVSSSRQILALSGGGYRGIFTAKILELLETRAKRPLREAFDLIAGTSIGGIIAAAVALEIPATTIKRSMIDHGEKIFGKRIDMGPVGVTLKNPVRIMYRAKHSSTPLRHTITDIFGNAADIPLNAVSAPLLITAINATGGQPTLFRSKGLAGEKQASTTRLIDALMATSAAPTYFAPHTIDLDVHVDGGLIANAPDLVALTDMLQLQQTPLDNVRLLSIGTAGSVHQLGRHAGKPGVLQWLAGRGLIQLILSVQEQLAVSQCEVLLRQRYLRINAHPGKQDSSKLGLDRAGKKAAKLLTKLARDEFAQTLTMHKQLLDRMLRHNQ